MEQLIPHIIEQLHNIFSPEIIVAIISTLPILELRGGLLAASLLNIDWKVALPICVIFNLLPIPFILIFINKIFEFLKKTRFSKIANKFELKAQKSSKSILKYEKLGLFLFVAIPLPGTGAWTGALAAAVLRLPVKESFISIALGVLSAGIIMSILSYGILGLFIR